MLVLVVVVLMPTVRSRIRLLEQSCLRPMLGAPAALQVELGAASPVRVLPLLQAAQSVFNRMVHLDGEALSALLHKCSSLGNGKGKGKRPLLSLLPATSVLKKLFPRHAPMLV